MVKKLPTIIYRKKKYYVDFRLGELRRVKDMKIVKFTQIKAGKYSPIKKKLRGLRFRYLGHEYIRGIDD